MRLYLLLIVIFLSCSNQGTTFHEKKPIKQVSFAGDWMYENSDSSWTFVLTLRQLDDSLYGNYCAVYESGKRIDCSDDTSEININGKIYNDSAMLHFESFFGAINGVASLKKKDNKLVWRIIQKPQDENCYAPSNVVLNLKR